MSRSGLPGPLVGEVRSALRSRGLRWTPQRRMILEVLRASRGHITAAQLVERCRSADPDVNASTVYRTLDVLEDLGLVVHSHGSDGREEYHVGPDEEHGHLLCEGCGEEWEIPPDPLAPLVDHIRREYGFTFKLSHLTIAGSCAACAKGRGIGVARGPGDVADDVGRHLAETAFGRL